MLCGFEAGHILLHLSIISQDSAYLHLKTSERRKENISTDFFLKKFFIFYFFFPRREKDNIKKTTYPEDKIPLLAG